MRNSVSIKHNLKYNMYVARGLRAKQVVIAKKVAYADESFE